MMRLPSSRAQPDSVEPRWAVGDGADIEIIRLRNHRRRGNSHRGKIAEAVGVAAIRTVRSYLHHVGLVGHCRPCDQQIVSFRHEGGDAEH